MTTRHGPASMLLVACIAAAAFFGSAANSDAQLLVSLKMNKKLYLAYEPVKAEVTVHNRSGHDAILAGPNKSNWVTFEIRAHNTILSPLRRAPVLRPMVLRSGKSLTKTIDLGQHYPMGDYGSYRVVASVWYPPLEKYFSSPQKRIEVTTGKKLWSGTVGVGASESRIATIREYSLMRHRQYDKTELYVRLREERGSRILATYSIGRLLAMRDPQAFVDPQNRLHVLHMGAPRVYAHTVIEPDGGLLKQEYYKEQAADRPKLGLTQSGAVRVGGGVKYDPTRPVASDSPDERLASELPPGLPR